MKIEIVELELAQAVQAYGEYLRKMYFDNFAKYVPNSAYYELEFQNGKKFIKVIHLLGNGQRSAHSFIVKQSDARFKAGDILKAAGWDAPAKNFVRGNIYQKNYGCIDWSGCNKYI